jgi:hypothetical protein
LVSVAPVRQKTFSVSPIFSDSGFEFPKPSVLVYDSRFLLVDAQSLVSDSWLDPELQVGQSLLPFGQGARNGAFVFLGIPLKQGKAAAQYYERDLVQTSSWYPG